MALVYHYTDTQAFAGIVGKAALWATDFRYLNDARELSYAWDPFVEALRRRASEPGEYSQTYAAQLKALELMGAIDMQGLEDSVYVACFTELRDALSQWSRYGANGHGIALGFDSDAIGSVEVPYFHHGPNGELRQMTAQVSQEDGTFEERPFTWGAYLEKVDYGEEPRDRLVNGLLGIVEKVGGKNGVGTENQKIGNCVFQTPGWLYRIPKVKHGAFADELEHRITLNEHFGGRSLGQLKALSGLGEPFSDYAQGALETLDVQFRGGGPTMFKPYVVLNFDRAALVEVVTGPAIKHQLVSPTIRRMLDRNGFRHTRIDSSVLPYQT